jgi:hypothetical protein
MAFQKYATKNYRLLIGVFAIQTIIAVITYWCGLVK